MGRGRICITLIMISLLIFFVQFRIRRGTDESNIESLAEASDPVVIQKDLASLPSEFFELKQRELEEKGPYK